MPPWPQLGEEGIRNVTHYVLQISGRTHDELKAVQGQAVFAANCRLPRRRRQGQPGARRAISPTKSGSYGGGDQHQESVRNGRNGQMPAWGEFLGAPKTHVLAAYVYGLSQPTQR
jgi:cytochrome c oxidase cbb3-type subunit 3